MNQYATTTSVRIINNSSDDRISVCGGGINNSSKASNSREASKQNSQSAKIQENCKINITCTEIIKYERLADVRSDGDKSRSAKKLIR